MCSRRTATGLACVATGLTCVATGLHRAGVCSHRTGMCSHMVGMCSYRTDICSQADLITEADYTGGTSRVGDYYGYWRDVPMAEVWLGIGKEHKFKHKVGRQCKLR